MTCKMANILELEADRQIESGRLHNTMLYLMAPMPYVHQDYGGCEVTDAWGRKAKQSTLKGRVIHVERQSNPR